MELTCTCGMKHFFGESIPCVRCPCGIVVYGNCDIVRNAPESRIKQKKPPRLWTEVVGWFRAPGDIGVGDTVQRIAAKFGGERFKKFAEKVGMPCGCTDRQNEWNKLWPYDR